MMIVRYFLMQFEMSPTATIINQDTKEIIAKGNMISLPSNVMESYIETVVLISDKEIEIYVEKAEEEMA